MFEYLFVLGYLDAGDLYILIPPHVRSSGLTAKGLAERSPFLG